MISLGKYSGPPNSGRPNNCRIIHSKHVIFRCYVRPMGKLQKVSSARPRHDQVVLAEACEPENGAQPAAYHDIPGKGSVDAKWADRFVNASGDLTAATHQANLADICLRAVLAHHAPAAVLINQERHVVFSMGPAERYLRVASGYASLDILAMAQPVLRDALKQTIDTAQRTQERTKTSPLQLGAQSAGFWFGIEVEPLSGDHRGFMLICFVDQINAVASAKALDGDGAAARIAVLEQELDQAKIALDAAIRHQEFNTLEQKAIHAEALSVNAEFQSTNDDLSALNIQLQETLARQQLASDDLQNVLYSTNVGTLFLDTALCIRYFTPAIKALFNIIPSDIGRPIADLRPIALDGELLEDARKVLADEASIEREVAVPGKKWFMRRIFPYLTHSGRVEGVVITFADITERKAIDAALEATKLEAERANIAKSRFLAAASHDLRQPLQSLSLLQELLVQTVEGDKPRKLLARFEQTLRAMAGMLNALLDINQIEAGAVQPKPTVFAVADIFERLRDEFGYMTQARGLTLRVSPSAALIESDPRLLEQMLRNLLGNAFKYTAHGTILLGCRRRGSKLRIEVWDTGIGIAADELHAIFEEFHQIDNFARERSRGLGLGLSIVQRLGRLLDHAVDVQSWPARGSMFAITVPLPATARISSIKPVPIAHAAKPHYAKRCNIMVVDDDPDVLDLLEQLLLSDGYEVRGAADAHAAMRLIAEGGTRPEILLTDYNLPKDMNGLELIGQLRTMLNLHLPAIILTGDIATETMAKIAAEDCVWLSKPVDPHALILAIEKLRAGNTPMEPEPTPDMPPSDAAGAGAMIHIIDDDPQIGAILCDALEKQGYSAHNFTSAEAFLAAYHSGAEGCLLVDAHLPGMSGLDLLTTLRGRGDHVPVILITGDGDIGLAVEAMRIGAYDFIEKPVRAADLCTSIRRAIEQSLGIRKIDAANEDAAAHVSGLTARQRQIMVLVLAGHPSKNIAADLAISQRTVENHRAAIMLRMGVKSLPELARLVMRAEGASGLATG